MPNFVRETAVTEPKFISAEDKLSPEQLRDFGACFEPLAKSMSALLGKAVKFELQIDDALSREEADGVVVHSGRRLNVEFYLEADDSKTSVAFINWMLQNLLRPNVMEAGSIVVLDKKLRGHDLGYQLFKVKREIGQRIGYEHILLNSMASRGGYPDHIVNKPEEKRYGWKEVPAREIHYLGKTYMGNITPEEK